MADLALDPLNYFLPFVAQALKRVGETVNTDLYAAVRDAYGQTRAQAIDQ